MTDKTAALVAEARQKMKPGFFGLFRKPDEAGELFEKAGGQYKLAKEWKESGDTYMLAADAFKEANDTTKTKNMYVEAAKAYKKVSSADAIRVYKIAATMHSEASQLSSAAKIYKEIGEMYESDHDLKSAIDAYSQASELFSAEDQVTTGNQCRVQVANLSAMVEDYRQAIVIYEEVASASLDNKLLQWSAKGYYFQALLCHLALSVAGGLDISGADDAIKQYKNVYPAFEGSRECKFCEQLLESISQCDLEKFEDALYEFDKISKLDSWKTSILLQIKKAMQKANSEVAELDLT